MLLHSGGLYPQAFCQGMQAKGKRGTDTQINTLSEAGCSVRQGTLERGTRMLLGAHSVTLLFTRYGLMALY